MEEVTQEQLKAHLRMLSDHKCIMLPAGADREFRNDYTIETDRAYRFKTTISDTYCWLYLHGEFGEDWDGDPITCLVDFTDEEMMSFVPAFPHLIDHINKFDKLLEDVEAAAKKANEYAKEYSLGEEVVCISDPTSLAEWYSSKC